MSFNNIDREGYVPPSVKKQQDHQRAKLAKDFKNRTVFLETKIESGAVNKTVAKKNSLLTPKKPDMVWKEGAYLASSAVEQQEHDRKKIGDVPVVIKKPANIQPMIFEEKPVVYSDKVQNLILPTKVARKIVKSVVLLTGSKPEYEIGQQYLADCGMDTSWVFKCPPEKELPICVDNESDGAWVPFIVLYRVDYFECKYVKEHGLGREFSQGHGVAYN